MSASVRRSSRSPRHALADAAATPPPQLPSSLSSRGTGRGHRSLPTENDLTPSLPASAAPAAAPAASEWRGRRRAQPLSISTLAPVAVSLQNARQLSELGGGPHDHRRRSRSRRSIVASDSTTPQQLTPRSMSDASERLMPQLPQSQRGRGKRRRSTEHSTPSAATNHAAAAAVDSQAPGSARRNRARNEPEPSKSDSHKRRSGGRRSQPPLQPPMSDASSMLQSLQAYAVPPIASGGFTQGASSNKGRARNRRRGTGGARAVNGQQQQQQQQHAGGASAASSAAQSPSRSPSRQHAVQLEPMRFGGGGGNNEPGAAAAFADLPPGLSRLGSSSSTTSGFSNRRSRGTRGGAKRGARRSKGGGGGSREGQGEGSETAVGSITPARLPAARFGTPYNSNAFLLNNVSRASPDLTNLLVPASAQYGSMASQPLSGASPAITSSERREEPQPRSSAASGGGSSSLGGADALVGDESAVPMSDGDGGDDDSGLSSIGEEESEAAAAAGADHSWRDDLHTAAAKLDHSASGGGDAHASAWQAPDTASLLAPPTAAGRRNKRRGGSQRSRKKRRIEKLSMRRDKARANDAAASASAPPLSDTLRAPVPVPSAAGLLQQAQASGQAFESNARAGDVAMADAPSNTVTPPFRPSPPAATFSAGQQLQQQQ